MFCGLADASFCDMKQSITALILLCSLPMVTPLSVFDLVPLSEGQSPQEALQASLGLARRAEELGYARLWYGEHHLNAGVLGYAPALMIGLAGAVTSSLRLGSGAVLAGQRTALSIAEEFSLLQAAFGPRVDLGIGRAAIRRQNSRAGMPPARSVPEASRDRSTREGLLLPAAPDLSQLLGSDRLEAASKLLVPEGAVIPGYGELIDQLLAFLDGEANIDGVELPEAAAPTPDSPEVWVLGSSAGESAEVAGRQGLRFGANYHVAPSNVTDAVRHYRDSFVPGRGLNTPYVIVSAEVLVAETDERAEHLAEGYAEWVYSIRSGRGAVPYPHPVSARNNPLAPAARPLVRDRVATRFVGTPERVADQLAVLQQATDADELLISTIAHEPQDRLRSFELLAKVWGLRSR